MFVHQLNSLFQRFKIQDASPRRSDMHIDMSCGDSVLLHLRSHKSEDAVHVHRGKLKGNEKRRNGRNLEMGGEQLGLQSRGEGDPEKGGRRWRVAGAGQPAGFNAPIRA